MMIRLMTVLGAACLSACASTLPNGAAPVASLYSFNDTARFMLRDVCLASVIEGVPLAQKADVPAVYPDERGRGWRAGPGSAVTVSAQPNGGCIFKVDRGIAMDLRKALQREIDRSPAGFQMRGYEEHAGEMTETYCASKSGYPAGLSVTLWARTDDPDYATLLVSADVTTGSGTCG